jgi:hypothetical protein
MHNSNPRQTLYCSFCGKSEAQVRKLIWGMTVAICDECVLVRRRTSQGGPLARTTDLPHLDLSISINGDRLDTLGNPLLYPGFSPSNPLANLPNLTAG